MQPSLSSPIVLIDSECVFCNYWGNYILKYDKSNSIFITIPESSLGRKIKPGNDERIDLEKTILLRRKNQIYLYSDAVLQLILQMNNIILYPLLIGFLIPKRIRDWIYLTISKKRKMLMTNQCHISNLRKNKRFIL